MFVDFPDYILRTLIYFYIHNVISQGLLFSKIKSVKIFLKRSLYTREIDPLYGIISFSLFVAFTDGATVVNGQTDSLRGEQSVDLRPRWIPPVQS